MWVITESIDLFMGNPLKLESRSFLIDVTVILEDPTTVLIPPLWPLVQDLRGHLGLTLDYGDCLTYLGRTGSSGSF